MLERFRIRLAGMSAQPLLALFGLVTGLLAGLVIVAFRLLVESNQSQLLADGNLENYEVLGAFERFLLPAGGGLLVGLMFYAAPQGRVGVLHVMERLQYHEGHLPLTNALLQFFGAAISLITGHSVGREGPSIHLGAASASGLGQVLKLPNNSIRTLVGCGTAAAIAASFNTPLAGVVFAMEVVMMEYTIAGFTPVILAAVGATVVSQGVYGAEVAFTVPALKLESLKEIPLIIIMGMLIGCLSVVFGKSLSWLTAKTRDLPIWRRTTLGGIGAGFLALWVPEVMGIGYDTVNSALLGQVGLGLLTIIVVFKLTATVVSIGFGLPGGLIGPTLFIGATAGTALGYIADAIPGHISNPGLYGMLGMGAMMGATLQAPLAALLALLELTANPHLILPAMLAIISANMTAKEVFGQRSIFLSQMSALGLDYRNDPVSQSLRRIGVASAMNRSYASVAPELSRDQASQLLADTPHWLIIDREDSKLLMPATDLARYMEETADEPIQLLEIPSRRQQLAAIQFRATLQQAKELIDKEEVEALYVTRIIAPLTERIYGVMLREDIEKHYRY